MPKVNIREIDNTGTETLKYLDYTVLVPGLIINDPQTQAVLGGLYTDPESFKKDVERCIPQGSGTIAEREIYDDKAIIMTYEYLKKGLSVYYAGIYTYITTDSSTVKRNGKIRPAQELDVEKLPEFYANFTDKGKYDLRFITTGGIADSYMGPACVEAIKCAGDRGDAIAILSAPRKAFNFDESGAEVTDLNTSVLIDKWINDTVGSVCKESILRPGISWTSSAVETYGRYAAFFAPSCDYNVVKIDRTNETVRLPASFMYITNFAKYIDNYACWYAMSGSIRGVSAYAPVYPTIKFGDKDVDIFQVRSGEKDSAVDGHVACNTICEIRPYGNIVWGNRTAHPLSLPNNGDAQASLQLTASSFLNIRHLCCAIKKQLYRSSRQYSFEPNSDILWINFKKTIQPLLDNMKANQGIRGYDIVKVKTNKKALLVARIKINPIEAVEDFDLTVELTDSLGVAE